MVQTAPKLLRFPKRSTRQANGVYYREDRDNYRMRKNIGYVDGVDVGELAIALGTSDREEAVKFYDAIMSLTEPTNPRPDILVQLKRGSNGVPAKLTPKEVYLMVKGQKVRDRSSVLNGDVRLKNALTEWLPNYLTKKGKPLKTHTSKGYARTIQNFLRKEWCPLDSTVRDIPRIYTRLHAYYISRQKNRTINKTKAMLLSFLRSTQSKNGKLSDMYMHVASLPGADQKPKDGAQGLMVHEALTMLKNLPERWRVIAEFMVFTGANYNEYRNTWQNGFEFLPDRVLVRGTKNENRVDRYVPRLAAFKELSEHPEDFYLPQEYKYLNRQLKKALPHLFEQGIEITSHDLRATNQQWLEEAGVTEFRAKCYMGRSTFTVHERYRRPAKEKQTQFLNSDRDLMTAFLQANQTAPQPVEKPTITYFEWGT